MCPFLFFFFNDTATTEIYTLSLHDALPICGRAGLRKASPGQSPTDRCRADCFHRARRVAGLRNPDEATPASARSEEHTSELQSLAYLVCRLLLEKKKKIQSRTIQI